MTQKKREKYLIVIKKIINHNENTVLKSIKMFYKMNNDINLLDFYNLYHIEEDCLSLL